jgi:anaerobic selenocysteine-containing dehydrogenase
MPVEAVIKKAACFFCHNNCGVLVHVQDGQVVKVEGNQVTDLFARDVPTHLNGSTTRIS